ncbi:hypothetical protein EV421DRAFT_1297768 [Armillaria borealis]|uniref:Transmembrane protein 135 N-terminal domain-containing protein n=1 Tax=Armillaria borealis TaxID=47425 RepID=A0AA39JW54_9AGAR|nr:hypothetical protein EV421DRAFT_1297768 [Armillaria borealis]
MDRDGDLRAAESSEATTPYSTPHGSPPLRITLPTMNRTSTDSTPPTPSSGIFATRRAMASFENLVALANHQERLREAGKMVWRVRGEPVVELHDLSGCLKHAITGGIRSGALAFNIRVAFNLILVFIRLRSIPKKQRLPIIGRAIFGTDTWRFAAMLGTFTSVYKFLINALPLFMPTLKFPSNPFFDDDEEAAWHTVQVPIPSPRHRRRSQRLSLSTEAQQVLVRKKTRRWHAALAGFTAGGLAVLFETRGRRITIAQQMFVRGLQGSFNAYTTARNITIPFGDVILFSLINAQVLYAAFMRPDTLPRSYRTWIVRASQVPKEGVDINHDLMRSRTFNSNDLDKILYSNYWKVTPENAASLLAKKEAFFLGAPDSIASSEAGCHCPCEGLHPGQTSCWDVPAARFFAVARFMLPVYGALHFLPPILFRTKAFMRDPLKILAKAGFGTARSCTFLGVYVVIYQGLVCARGVIHEFLTSMSPKSLFKIPQWLVDFLFMSRAAYWWPGLPTGLSLLIEEKKRRAELSMYVLPKALESFWNVTTGKVPGGLKGGKAGEALLSALGMAMVMSTYQMEPHHLSGLVRRILYQFIGPN